ncbi:MAG: LamG-like jellyroll fold domain-containing protein, partial [Nitrosotalea sp.]
MKAKIFSISIFCLLAISLLTIASNDATAMNNENTTVQKNSTPDQTNTISQNSKSTKQVEIDLNDGVSVSANDPQNQGHHDLQYAQPILHQQIDLSEKLAISINKPGDDMIILVKQSSDNLTTLERITGIDRLRFDGRKLVEEKNGLNLSDQNQLDIISYAQNKIRTIDELTINYIGQDITNSVHKFAPPLGIQLDSIATSIQHRTQLIVGNSYVLGNDLTELAHSAADLKNPTLLIVLVPLSGYILIRSEGTEITFYNSKRFVSLVLFVIIISSTVIGPVSVSPSFLAYAYSQANESNTSAIISEQNVSQTNSGLNFNGYSNSTQALNLNGYSNSTQALNLNGYSNSTQALNLNGYSNSTQITSAPNATQSWNFGTKNNKTQTIGQIELDNTTNSTALQLQGNGYLTANGSATKEIKDLTLSAWVKPDFSQGSPVFTVISKEGEFALSINNIIPPYKIAQFSVFDGIKWDTVNSTVPIGQTWTNLAATFNGSSISLYVNGTLQSSVPLTKMMTISEDGNLATKNSTDLSSNADIVIGAEYNSIRKEASSQFSGLISNVNLYDSLLTSPQISDLYNQNLVTFYPQLAHVVKTSLPANSTLTDALALLDNVSLNYTDNSNMTNSTLLNYTVSANSLNLNPTESAYKITDNPELHFQYVNDTTFAKLSKMAKMSKGGSQSGAWQSNSEDIKITLLDPHGKTIPANATFAKIREGKFDITIPSARYGKPGLYTAIVELTKDGKKYVSQTQFAWGLVIVNTNKSIYKPGETADLTIVVLDNGGRPVCNSQISLDILSPDLTSTLLSSGNGISRDKLCGVYDAQYLVSSEGNYTVNVTASTPNGITHFSTYFLAKNNYDFDIIRTADSKIDPINNPNLFNVRIDIGSYVNTQGLTIKEFVPSVFNITTDGSVQTVGDTKVLTWNKDLVGNKTFVQYSYSVPLDFPQIYALGPVQITYGSGESFTEARQWFVANDPAGTIGEDAAQGFTTSSAANSLSGSITVGNNNYRVLVVGISVQSGTNNVVSTVKDGSTAFTYITSVVASHGGTHVEDEMWYLINPPIGSNTITATLTAGTTANMVMGVTSLYGVDNSTTIGTPVTNISGGQGSTTPSVAVTTTKTNSWVVDSLSVASNTGAQTTGATQSSPLYSGTVGSTLGGFGSDSSTTTTGSYTSSWLLGASSTWAEIGVEFIPSGIKAPLESLALSDTLFLQRVKHVSLSEPLLLSDNLNLIKSISTNLPESLQFTDSVTKSKTFKLAMVEALTLSDSVSTLHNNLKSLSDSLTLSDSVSTLHNNLKSLSDSLTLSDSVSTTRSSTQSLSDSLDITDTAATTRSSTQSLSDSLDITDTAATTRSSTQSLSDSLTLSDSVSATRSVTQPLTDSLDLTDSVSATRSVTQPLTDSLDLTDSVS